MSEMRRAVEASWVAASLRDIRPTIPVVAGALLAAAGGNAVRAIAKLTAVRDYLELVASEDVAKAKRVG